MDYSIGGRQFPVCESLPEVPICTKRGFTEKIRLTNGQLITSVNICLAVLLEADWACRRLDSASRRKNGKDWGACYNSHAEVNGILTFLVRMEVISLKDYLEYVARFARAKFTTLPKGSLPRKTKGGGYTYFTEEGEVLLQELLDLVPFELRYLLNGASSDLGEEMDWACYACGQVHKMFGIQTPRGLFVAETPWDEPSTDHLRHLRS